MARWTAVIAAVLALALPARAQSGDPWLGEDKALHCAAAALLAGGGFALASLLLESQAGRLGVGAALAVGAGIGKELWDERSGGDPSFRDLTWDAVGAVIGLVAGWGIVAALDASSAEDQAATARPGAGEAAGDSISDQLFPAR
ncbi:MAG: hypothetical protein JXR83_05410 [Deltaproteobacteria bacterium]|nr:hypothetical protein [Deltaproteobacteria bacterium]